MEKVAAAPTTKPASQPANAEIFQRTEEQQESAFDAVFKQDKALFRADGRGFDLTGVPGRRGTSGTEEMTPRAEVDKPGEGIDKSAEASGNALIVEDAATELQEGQMSKSRFLQLLGDGIREAIEPVLARVGQTTEGCPYLNYWLGLYQHRDAAHIERTVKKYAPDSADARTAEEYISVVVQRALRAAEIWALIGKISGVPEGGMMQAKSKSGGVRRGESPKAIQRELGEGQPLASDVRGRMESAFGMNFSNVRTHTDAMAMEVSNRINARAFTVGNHVAFGRGEYQPGTMMGDALIAHELAHTIQQEGPGESMDKGAGGSVDKMETGDAGYHALERDADNTAFGVMSRLWGGEKGMKGAVQRSIPLLRSGLKLQRCGASQSGAVRTAPTTPAASTAPGAPDVCPTSVVLESTQDLTPGGLALGYRTGYGIVSIMHLLPDTVDWTSARVFERVSQASSSCPDTWGICNPGSQPFPINQPRHSTVLGDMPAQRNRFYDFHTSRWNSSRLHDSVQNPTGMDECSVICNQSYVCGDRVLGNFRITRNFHKAMRNGREITEVNATKTAAP